MPTLHRSWDHLREKLLKIDLQSVEKRIGSDHTLVFELERLEYDKSVPIISEDVLERWTKRRDNTNVNFIRPPGPGPTPFAGANRHLKSTRSARPDQSHAKRQRTEKSTTHVRRSPTRKPKVYLPEQAKPKPTLPSQPRKLLVKNRPKLNRPRPDPQPSTSRDPQPSTSRDPPPSTSRVPQPCTSRDPQPSTSRDPQPSTSRVPQPSTSRVPQPSTSRVPQPSTSRGLQKAKEIEKTKKIKKAKELEKEKEKENFSLLSDTSDDTQESQDSIQGATAVWKCATDQLVINEPIDDEYAKYINDDDDDEPETELSKNLKKIRPVVPTSKPLPPPPPKPAHLAHQSREPPRVKSPVAIQLVEEPPEPPKPPEPNWTETSKALQANNFPIVYKDLAFFKDRIKEDQLARTVLKESVIKCIHEDETNLLVDTLSLVYELDYTDDVEFWSELVLRLKRKLSNHCNIRSFKSKTNPEWVYESYKRAIKSISQYARTVNLTVRLPFHSMIFLINPFNDCDNGDSKVEPMQEKCLNRQDVEPKPKVELKQESKPREVTLVKKDNGSMCFMISKPKKKEITVS